MPPLNLARWCIETHASRPGSADRPALTFLDAGASRSWTYTELWASVERAARTMAARGLQPGDRVLIRAGHSPEYALAFFGATLAGLVPIPASPLLTAAEIAFLLEDSGASAIVLDRDPPPEHFAGAVLRTTDLEDGSPGGALGATDAEDPAYMLYTSGTTSRPKGVLHAHRTVHGRALMRTSWQDWGPGDRTLHAGTLNWSYTMGVGLMDPWAAGAHAFLAQRPDDPAGWLNIIREHEITVFAAVPTVFRQVLKYAPPGPLRLPSLRHVLCAGEPLPPALLDEWRERAGTEMYESLGMTEISTYISSGPATPVRPGSPGKPQPGRRIAILPADSRSTEPLPAGEVGLLAVHRSDPGLMLGYWQRPEEEAEVFRGDWFTGGDLASIDEDGYVWFHGRADDTIKSFGYRISPVEIEHVLESHPLVTEAAVVGQDVGPQKTLLVAFVSGEEGLSVEQLREHVAGNLAEYKRPHEYVFTGRLPRTANGKLRRQLLREQLRDA